GDVFRVGLLGRNLGDVFSDTLSGPWVEIYGRKIEQATAQLEPRRRTNRLDQPVHLLLEIVEADVVRFVVDQHRSKAGSGLNHAAYAFALDRRGESLRHEVEFEIHLVPELNKHVAVAAREEPRLVVNHAITPDARPWSSNSERWTSMNPVKQSPS